MTDLRYSTILKKIQKNYPNIDFVKYFESGCNSRTRFLEQIQERFQDVTKDIKLMVMAPEEVNFIEQIYAINNLHYKTNYFYKNTQKYEKFICNWDEMLDEDYLDDTIIKEFFANKLSKIGINLADIYSIQDFESLKGLWKSSQNMDKNAFVSTYPYNVEKENGRTNINKALSILVMNHSSYVDIGMFTDIPGSSKILKKLNITPADIDKMVIYHELGHAVETENAMQGLQLMFTADTILANSNRYRTECIADIHSIFQMARDKGNTNIAEPLMMARAKYLKDAFLKFKFEYDDIQQDAMNEVIEMYGESDFEQEHIDNAISYMMQEQMESLGESLTYFTPPCIDYARKIADKMLIDGSLQKMTDKEVLKLSVDTAKASMFEKNQLISMFHKVVKGDTDNALFKTLNEYTQASHKYFGITKDFTMNELKEMQEERQEKLRNLGFETEENGLDKQEKDNKNYARLEFGSMKMRVGFKLSQYDNRKRYYLESQLPDYESLPPAQKHMQTALVSMEFANVEINNHREYYSNMHNHTNNKFKLDCNYIGGIKEADIDDISQSSRDFLFTIDLLKNYIEVPHTSTKKYSDNIYDLVAEFIISQAQMLDIAERNHGKKSTTSVILSLQDKVSAEQKQLSSLEKIAGFQRESIHIAKLITSHNDFDALKSNNHTRMIKEIEHQATSKMGFFIEEYYPRNFDKNAKTVGLIFGNKVVFNKLLTQRGCGIKIASNLTNSDIKNRFVNGIKVFNSHSTVKKIHENFALESTIRQKA